jgi:8-oxo-dGTP diphosphatase
MAHTSEHPIFAVTVDIAILTVHRGQLQVLLVRRGNQPYAGRLALPGGFVEPDEDLHEAAARELREETGVEGVVMEQLRSYGAPGRDPRQRVVSVAHVAILPERVRAVGGDDAAEAVWRNVGPLLRRGGTLAFDHRQILRDAVERVRSKLEYTTLATAFVPAEFSLSELRHVYEVVWDRELDAGNFQRKIKLTEGLVEPTGDTRLSPAGRGRPAAMFRAVRPGVHELKFPITRPSASG